MPLNRRHLLASAATPWLGACATAPAPPPLAAQLDRLHADWLAESPHNATAYGLDTGAHAPLRSRWPARSRADAERLAAGYRDARARLHRTPAAGGSDGAATRDAALFALDAAIEGAAFAYGDQTLMAMIDQEATPYPLNQMIGLAASGPQLLAAQQPLRTADDRQAFLDRLAALGPAIDAETGWFRHDAARGVRPPAFILQTVCDQLDAQLAAAPQAARTTAAFAAAGGDAARADALWRQAVLPAVARQRDAVAEALPQAGTHAGVAALPDGERYYAWALRVATSTALSPREVHALGLELARGLDAEMDALLRGQGLSQGTTGQRLAALGADARQRFANDDAGRAAAIAHCKRWLERLAAGMSRWSRLALQAPVRIERVPPEREAGAAGAYMAPGALDGSRPAVFYINLRDTGAWPRWTLPTLVAHETVPGHAWQEAYEAERAARHPLRGLLRFNGYSEGWALYAERLVDESGFYADDPLARLGHLQAQQLRAVRLVVDTGLHAFGWTRERAVQVLADATGRPRAALEGEVDRYCVKPGQACGYMVGQRELQRLRTRWIEAGRGDAASYNDAVLAAGNLPLSVLDRVLAAG